MRDVPFFVPEAMAAYRPEIVHEWHVAVGSEFAQGTALVTIETEVARIEVSSPYPGRLKEIHAGVGYPATTGTQLATIEVTDWVYDNQIGE
jgi:pyruvate/2-oxoglutarate dehydrogenase complex dihydrolipoamide acyltransferase (E2) component